MFKPFTYFFGLNNGAYEDMHREILDIYILPCYTIEVQFNI